jgi:two-component system sensor histidine kinase/response regulator
VEQHDTTEAYDVIFMDWRMPGMDGLQATRSIRGQTQLRKQPAVVMTTAFGREEVREQAEKLGIDAFLVKPVTRSMVVDCLVTLFAAAPEEATRVAGDEHGARLDGARILLAEDNEINQQIAVELLEGAGARVQVANTGREAVDLLMREPSGYDLVLMDLQMPEMDGYQATLKIRAESRDSSLPVIAMTAHATIEERQRCLAVGMNDHVSKPIDPAALFETLGRYYRPVDKPETGVDSPNGQSTDDVATSTGAGKTPLGTEELPSVEGLNTVEGLRRIGGNRKLYLKLLRQFVEEQSGAPEVIAESLAAGDRRTAERVAHTLKGVAGNLGAVAVQAAASDLEKAIAGRGDVTQIDLLRQTVAARLAALIAQLRFASGDQLATDAQVAPSTAAPDPERLKTAVAEMLKQLGEFDAAAADCLETNNAVFRSLFTGADFARFERRIQSYSFGEAQAQLEHAAKEGGLV